MLNVAHFIDADKALQEIEKVYLDHYKQSLHKCMHDFYNAVRRRLRRAESTNVIELPIKVGQIIYTDHEPWRKEVHIDPYIVTSISISQNKKGIWTKTFRASWYPDSSTRSWSHDLAFDDLGNKAFFTKEAAIAAWNVRKAQ